MIGFNDSQRVLISLYPSQHLYSDGETVFPEYKTKKTDDLKDE